MKKSIIYSLCLLLAALSASWAATMSDPRTVWEGELELSGWDVYKVFPGTEFSDLTPGSKIIISYKDLNTSVSQWPQIHLQHEWTEFLKSDVLSAQEGDVTFDIDETTCTTIKNDGVQLKGIGVTVTKIQLIVAKSGTELPPPTDAAATQLWKGSKNIDWSTGGNDFLNCPSALFANVKEGDILRFNIGNVKGGAQAHLNKSDWSSNGLPDGYNGYLPVSAPWFEFEVNDELITELQTNGIILTGIGFTLTSIEAIDPTKIPDVTASFDENQIREYKAGEMPNLTLTLKNNHRNDPVNVDTRLILTRDSGENMAIYDRTAEIDASSSVSVSFSPEITSGVYHVTLIANNSIVKDFNIAYDLTGIKSETDTEDDFNKFWEEALTQLETIDPDYTLTELTEKSSSKRKVYFVEMKSIPDGYDGEPVTIRGYYLEPTGKGPFPAIITYQGYDSAKYGPDGKATDPYCPEADSNPDYAEFILSTRGQSINNREPYENIYGDWFAFNFGDKRGYYYRGAYMDCVRAVDFITSRDKVDKNAICAQGQSQGGAFTIAAAALSGKIAAIAPAVPFMGDFPDYFKVASWPASVAFAQQQEKGMSASEMYSFLSYFDTKNLAKRISCPTLMALGLQDNVCPPHTNMAFFNNVPGDNKSYIVNPLNAHSVPSTWYDTYLKFFDETLHPGQYITVTTNLWKGSQEIDWNGPAIDASFFNHAAAGDKIEVTISQIGDASEWPQFRILDKSYKALYKPNDKNESFNLYENGKSFATPYKLSFEITPETLSILKNGGCRISGTRFTLASVDLLHNAKVSTNKKNPAPVELWTGDETISWSGDNKNSILIDKSKFADMSAGDIVRVEMSGVASNAQLRLQANYTQFDPVYNIQLKGAEINEAVFDDAMIELVKQNGLRLTGCYYNLNRVTLYNPDEDINFIATVNRDDIRAWGPGETPEIGFDIQSLEGHDYTLPLEVKLTKDVSPTEIYRLIEKEFEMKSAEAENITVGLGDLEPGFYNLIATLNGKSICSYVIGYDPTSIESPYDGQEDFEEFWERGLTELAATAPNFSLVKEMTDYSTATRKVWYVEMQSIPDSYGGSPVTISGYYAEPTAEGKYPTLIHYLGTDGGTSTPTCIKGDDNPDWCELILSVRGQMLNNRDPYKDRNIYTASGEFSYYTFGFLNQDKREHYYYGAYLDCVRAIDFIESREKCDRNNIFVEGSSQGGAFTYAAAGLGRGRIRAAAAGITGHADFVDDFKIVSWPADQFNTLIANSDMDENVMFEKLSYFDVKNFAPYVTCAVTTNFSLQDTTDPPHVNISPYNLLTNVDETKKEYSINSFLGHSTAPDWTNRYMEFFNKHMYSPTTSIDNITPGESAIDIRIYDGEVSILNAEERCLTMVFNPAGSLVLSTRASSFRLPAKGLYIIKSGNRIAKIKY